MDQELQMRLEAALDDMAPKLTDKILAQDIHPIASEAELFSEAPETMLHMSPGRRKQRRRIYSTAAGLAAAFALLFCFQQVRSDNMIEGQIIVDVNPSVSLSVNKRGRVKRVEALNADGSSIVEGLDKRKGTVDAVLDSVFDSLERQNYLRSEKAGVLVSYCYVQESADVEAKIQTSIVNQSSSRQNCTIFSQTFARADEEEELARTAGVSVGKYYFVNRIREGALARTDLTYDKTMEEIVQIMDDQGVQVAGVEVYTGGGQASAGTEAESQSTEHADVSVETTEMAGNPNGTSAENTETVAENTQGTEADTQIASNTESSSQNTQGTDTAASPGGGSVNTGSGQQPDVTTPGTEQSSTVVDVSSLRLGWVTAELGDDQKIYIEWDALDDVSGYDIYYRSVNNQNYERIAEGVTGDTCVVAGLTPGRSYTFRVVPYVLADGKKHYGKGSNTPVVEIPPIQEAEPPVEETETETETEISTQPAETQIREEQTEEQLQH